MSVQRLTKRVVEALKPLPEREFWTWDADVKGFGVRVKPSGSKSYVIQYRTRQGVLRKYTIGATSLVTVEDARTKASRLLLSVKDGEDPALKKAEDRNARSLNDVWDDFVKGYLDPSKRKVKPLTLSSYVALYERHVRGSSLGSRPIDSINEDELRKFHSSLSATPYSANRTLAALSSCFSYTFGKRRNPCIGIGRFQEAEVERKLSPDDLKALGDSLKRFSNLPRRLPSLAPFFLLTALTGTRKGEWISARWKMIHWDTSMLWLEDSKTGSKPVEIPAPALQVLEFVRDRARSLGEYHPEAYVLPGRLEGKPLVNPYKAWDWIRKDAKVSDLRIHDLRHLFGTVSHRSGANQKTVAMLLGHSQLKTTERYLHGYDEDRKRAAETTAYAIARAIEFNGEVAGGTTSLPSREDEPRTALRASKAPSGDLRRRTKRAR